MKKYITIKKTSKLKKYWKSRNKTQRGLFFACLCLLTALIIAICTVGYFLTSVLSKIERDDEFNKLENSDLGFIQNIDEDVYNIALFGIDTRQANTFSGNSDSIMILSLNLKSNTIKLVSVLRDSLVPIDKNGKTVADKINSAYANGGPTSAVKTLNTVFGLDISEYATVNFYGMIDIIDEVGGIDAEITKSELTCKININTHIKSQCDNMGIDHKQHLISNPGRQHLNGIQAVAYARIRYGTNWLGSTNDFGRTERQRYVMEQLLKKALSLDIASYPSLVNKLAPYVKTSFKNNELLELAMFLKNKPTMETSRIPHDEYIINSDYRGTGASAVYFNYEYAAKVLHAYLYDNIKPADYMTLNGIDKTGWHSNDSSNSTSSKQPTTSSTTPSTPPTSSEESSSETSSTTSSEEVSLPEESQPIESETVE